MNRPSTAIKMPGLPMESAYNSHSSASAVAWGAIFAGAAAAAALSLILLILGTGLGLSSVSPWAMDGVSAGAFGASTVLWVTFTQVLAAGMGGYLAGRLRTRWLQVHADEVYFRDTAHGFLAWAVASLATAALLGSVIGSIVQGGVQAAASITGGAASVAGATVMAGADSDGESMGYFVDRLFRNDGRSAAQAAPADAASEQTPAASAAEVSRIFVRTLRSGQLAPEDLSHVGRVVAQATGLTEQEAQTRVRETYAAAQSALRDAETTARDAADKARKASAAGALWLFVSLLVGAFVASFAATWGGRQRDL